MTSSAAVGEPRTAHAPADQRPLASPRETSAVRCLIAAPIYPRLQLFPPADVCILQGCSCLARRSLFSLSFEPNQIHSLFDIPAQRLGRVRMRIQELVVCHNSTASAFFSIQSVRRAFPYVLAFIPRSTENRGDLRSVKAGSPAPLRKAAPPVVP